MPATRHDALAKIFALATSGRRRRGLGRRRSDPLTVPSFRCVRTSGRSSDHLCGRNKRGSWRPGQPRQLRPTSPLADAEHDRRSAAAPGRPAGSASARWCRRRCRPPCPLPSGQPAGVTYTSWVTPSDRDPTSTARSGRCSTGGGSQVSSLTGAAASSVDQVPSLPPARAYDRPQAGQRGVGRVQRRLVLAEHHLVGSAAAGSGRWPPSVGRRGDRRSDCSAGTARLGRDPGRVQDPLGPVPDPWWSRPARRCRRTG